jgi:hypothetical protein
MRLNNVFWSVTELARDLSGFTTDILAIGDSWFWYPMPGGSLISFIGDEVALKGHNILVAGNNGAEAYDYVRGKYRRQVKELLRLYGPGASAVLVSGGGNDFAGFNDLHPMLMPDCSAATTSEQCFRPGNDEGTYDFLLEKMYENYALLLSRIFKAVPSSAKVVLHCYDYAVPDGRGMGGGSAWLKPALESARVPKALHGSCIRRLIDGAHGVMQSIAVGTGGRAEVVDSRGTLASSDWANELHPRPKGFQKIAQVKWRPVLQGLGLA